MIRKFKHVLFSPLNFFITFFTRKLRPRSIRRLFVYIFSALLSVFLLVFLITSSYYYVSMRDRLYNSIQDTLAIQNTNINRSFQETLVYLSETCLNNSDISSLNTTNDKNEIYLNTIRIKKTLSVGNYALSNIGGLFVYSQTKDVFIPQNNESWNSTLNIKESNRECSRIIMELIRKERENGTLEQLNMNDWFLLGEEHDYFLMRILNNRDTYAGAWTRLEYLFSAYESFNEMDAIILYVDEAGNCIGNSDFADIKIDPKESLLTPSSFISPSGNYLAVSAKLDYCKYYITVLVPNTYFFKELAWLYWLMGFIFLWLVLLTLTLTAIMSRFFNTPSQILNPVIASLRNGHFDAKIEPVENFQEIQNITDTFNDMISEIQNLRIQIYEDELTYKELELQYLKSQVAPHFLINCLNTIFVLSQEPAGEAATHALVSTLSEHLRYTLASRTEASLEEELNYVKNYLYLTQLRFPDTLRYEIQIEPVLLQAKVFPLILLMLTENSVKINVIMGEDFLIKIHGHLYEHDKEKRIRLTHIDSGKGFDETYLDIYNNIIEHPEICEKGKSIGLYNTAMRLRHVFGTSAYIYFSNETGMGARIDIDIPYIIYTKEEEAK